MTLGKRRFDIRKMLYSMAFFLSNLFVKRHYDVIFFYPAHFNRGYNGENAFFEELYKTCDAHGIDYLVIEEPTFKAADRRSDKAVPFDFVYICVFLLRKLSKSKDPDTFSPNEWKIAKILKPLLFLRFSFDNYVVLSKSMMAFFRGLQKDAAIYDYQHGIVYSTHIGYFEKSGDVMHYLRQNDANVLLFGRGFLKLLLEKDSTGYYRTHAFVTGYPKRIDISRSMTPRERWRTPLKIILFTSTIVDDTLESHIRQYETILNFFRSHTKFFESRGLHILFKHHPRYECSIDMSELFALPFVSACKRPIDSALEQSFLHMTMVSTSTFEASGIGVPTLLWNRFYEEIEAIFIDEYAFPLGLLDDETLLTRIERYLADEAHYLEESQRVQNWYRTYYEPFQEKRFISLLSKKSSVKIS